MMIYIIWQGDKVYFSIVGVVNAYSVVADL